MGERGLKGREGAEATNPQLAALQAANENKVRITRRCTPGDHMTSLRD